MKVKDVVQDVPENRSSSTRTSVLSRTSDVETSAACGQLTARNVVLVRRAEETCRETGVGDEGRSDRSVRTSLAVSPEGIRGSL